MDERLAFGYGTAGHRATARPVSPTAAESDGSAVSAARDGAPEARDWAFIGLLLFTAVLFLRPQDTFTPLRIVPVAEMAAIFALGAMVFGRLGRGLSVTRLNAELVAVVALAGVMLATAPFSVWPGGVIGTFTGMYAKVVLIFILMINTLTSPRRVERFIWMIVLASGYLSARAVFDYARGVNLIEYGRVQGSVGGMFKNPNDLALNMVAVMPLAVMLAFRTLPLIRRAAAALCALAMLGAIVASQSRSGTVGLAVLIIVMGIYLARRRPGLVFAAVLTGVLASPLAPASYWERVASITNKDLDQTGSREARSTLLRESYAAFLANPLTGVGAGQFKNYDPEGRTEAWREAHNVVLQVAAELGIFGLMVYVFLLGCAFYAPISTQRLLRRLQGRRTPRGPPPAAPLSPVEQEQVSMQAPAVFASVLGWFICALFASVAYHWTFYYVLAMAVAPRDYLVARVTAERTARRHRAVQPIPAGAHP